MIHTSRQLKALVRNRSHGDNVKAMTLIRNFAMERFLERMSLSNYSSNLILKGGLLVASMVGLDNRATMDIDTTIRNYHLSEEDAGKMIEDIIAVPLDDGIQFAIKGVESIMDEAEYPGIRFKLEAVLDTMKTPLKMDISTDDVITPGEVNYEYKLMFEERSISILAYNLETVLAEKMETVISRGTLNTRMTGNPHYFDRDAAAGQLLDHLTESGAVICYSGDLDPDGMDIADRLWQRCGNSVQLWRMRPEDYRELMSGEALSDRQLVKLKNLKNVTLRHTAELVQKEKMAGYQENMLKQLTQDVLKRT